MNKKFDSASALANIINAKRGGDAIAPEPDPVEMAGQQPAASPPSPALPPSAPKPELVERKPRNGKSSDKATFSQFSVYLRKDTRKKVGRALEDAETGQDFSDLVQELLEQWLKKST